jgi:hypothetical protein
LFAVPRRSHSEKALEDVRDLTKPIQEELEKFFIATDELEDKKLDIIGWRGFPVSELRYDPSSLTLFNRGLLLLLIRTLGLYHCLSRAPQGDGESICQRRL